MKSIVFLFVGIILVGVGVICYFSLGSAGTTIVIQGVRDNSAETRSILQYSIGGFLGGLGAIFVLAGLVSLARASKQNKQHIHLMQTGTDAQGTVTYVDKNYSILLNKKPIYSIVEYIYQDRLGKQYTNRFDKVNSDYVIRKQILVGSKVAIKYAAEDPSKSTIVI